MCAKNYGKNEQSFFPCGQPVIIGLVKSLASSFRRYNTLHNLDDPLKQFTFNEKYSLNRHSCRFSPT